MAYTESRLPSTAKKKTSKGATKAVRKSSGLSGKPAAPSLTQPAAVASAAGKVRRAKTPRQRTKAKILRKLLKDDSDTTASLTPKERKLWERISDPEHIEKRSEAKLEKWWEEAKSVSGLKGPAPKMILGAKSPAKEGHLAHVVLGAKGKPVAKFAGHGLSPAARPADRKAFRQLALHEFAHVGQSRSKPKSNPAVLFEDEKALSEGRAERFSKLVSKRLGKKFSKKNLVAEYDPYRKQSRKEDTRRKILRGQFKEQGEVKPWWETQAGAIPAKKRGAQKPERKAKPKSKKPLKVKLDSAGLLGPRQTAFTTELAKRTGLSARVLGGMAASEQPKDSPSVEGSDNWLNIGYYDFGPGGPTQDPKFFKGPKEAAKTTAKFLKGKELGASEGIQSILRTAGKSDQKQVEAIQSSGWASSGHPNLPALASQMSGTPGKKIVRAKEKGRPVKAVAETAGLLSGATKLKPDQRQTLKAMVKEATKIDEADREYVWGGGHVAGKIPGIRKTGYDCSSVTSRILQKAGALPKSSGALVSGDFMNYGAPGPGTVTIFANPTHVFMRIGDRYYGTSSQDNTGSGGFLTEATGRSEAASGEYTVRHVPELGKAKIGLKNLPGISLSGGGTTATITSSTTLPSAGSSTKPITPAKTKAKKMEGRKKSQLVRKLIAEGPAQVPVTEAVRSTTPFSEQVKKTPIKLGL